MTDPIRNIIEEKINRRAPYPDETNDCFANEPFIINESYPFCIRNHLKKSSYDYFKSELDRRDQNESKRQEKYWTIMRKKDENIFRINQTTKNSRNNSIDNTIQNHKRTVSLDKPLKLDVERESVRINAETENAPKLNLQSKITNNTQPKVYATPKNSPRASKDTSPNPLKRKHLSMGNLKCFTKSQNNVFGNDGDHRHPKKVEFTTTYQNDFLKNKRPGINRHLRTSTNTDLRTIYNNMASHINTQHKSTNNSFRKDYRQDDDFPIPQTIEQTSFVYPPSEGKKILNRLKLQDRKNSLNKQDLENAQDFAPENENASKQSETCRKLDIPAHYGNYSNKPLNTMLNPNHHKTIRSTHGKIFKSLTPWKDTQNFHNKFYYDPRTKATPRAMFKNSLMDSIARDHKNIERVSGLSEGVFKLKSQTILRDDNSRVIKVPGSNKITYVYNDYHRKRAKDGFSRCHNDGKPWGH